MQDNHVCVKQRGLRREAAGSWERQQWMLFLRLCALCMPSGKRIYSIKQVIWSGTSSGSQTPFEHQVCWEQGTLGKVVQWGLEIRGRAAHLAVLLPLDAQERAFAQHQAGHMEQDVQRMSDTL